jgi:hypothetical protein
MRGGIVYHQESVTCLRQHILRYKARLEEHYSENDCAWKKDTRNHGSIFDETAFSEQYGSGIGFQTLDLKIN